MSSGLDSEKAEGDIIYILKIIMYLKVIVFTTGIGNQVTQPQTSTSSQPEIDV